MVHEGTKARPPRQRLTLEITVLLATFIVVIGVWTRTVVLPEAGPATAGNPAAARIAATDAAAAAAATAEAHRHGRTHPPDAEPTSDPHLRRAPGARPPGPGARDVRLDGDPSARSR